MENIILEERSVCVTGLRYFPSRRERTGHRLLLLMKASDHRCLGPLRGLGKGRG